MRHQIEENNVHDQIPPLVIPSGVDESQIACIMTSLVLRAALEASTPWHKWILLSALQLLHGRPPASLDSQTFDSLVNFEQPIHKNQINKKTISQKPSKDSNNQKNSGADDTFNFHLNITDEELWSSDMNISSEVGDPTGKDLCAEFNVNSEHKEEESNHVPSLLSRKNAKPNFSPCLEQELDKKNDSANKAHRNIDISSPSVLSRNKNSEIVNLDMSFVFDPSCLFVSPPFAVSSPKESIHSSSQFDFLASSDDHQPLSEMNVLPKACRDDDKTANISDHSTKAKTIEDGSDDCTTESTSLLNPKAKSDNVSKVTKEEFFHEVPDTFKSSTCNLIESTPLNCEVSSNSTLNNHVLSLEDKISTVATNENALKMQLCRKTPIVVIKKEDMQIVEEFLTATANFQPNQKKEMINLGKEKLKHDVGVQVKCEKISFGVQAKPKTCTKWIQVRKKKFMTQGMQTTVKLPLNTENADKISQTDVREAMCDIPMKMLVGKKDNESQTILLITKSVATQTISHRRKWKLELLSGLPPPAELNHQSTTDSEETPLFHGCPLNLSRETIPPLIPLHAMDGICSPASDPRLE